MRILIKMPTLAPYCTAAAAVSMSDKPEKSSILAYQRTI